MKTMEKAVLWVAYRKTMKGKTKTPIHAVCNQEEWDQMKRANPGLQTLIRAGLHNETDAERLARSSPGGFSPQ
jgi:hypothetical protein